MATNKQLLILSIAVTFALATACGKKDDDKKKPAETPAAESGKPDAVEIPKAMLSSFAALPASFEGKDTPLVELQVDLGRMLYFETRLSKNHDISCNSCHLLDKYGVDSQPTSPGHKGQRGNRNSPTVYNAAGHIAQFWDGRAADVEAQAKGPVLNPVEMAMTDEAQVVAVLDSIPGYVDAFGKAFPDQKKAVSYDNMAIAIGAFERKLVTPSRWDTFLGGDAKALTSEEQAGFMEFANAGCMTCHTGALLGGESYQKLGLVKPWPSDKDTGRDQVTKKAEDKMKFKVPSLRNIAKTGPYFHDGSVSELPLAIKMMAEHQLGRSLTDPQIASIAVFLASLTGELPTEYIKAPTLPESGPKTPKPDPS